MTIPTPEYHNLEEFQVRLKKLHEIKNLGIDPYPHKFEPTHTPKELHDLYEGKEIGHSDDAAAGDTDFVRVAGRLVLFRAMGKNAFAQIQDETGRIQLMFNRDLSKVKGYDIDKSEEKQTHIKFIEKKLDLGDIIGIEGNIFKTQKGELTIFVKEVTLLCKALLPLPDKHSGLADKGVRYRKRHLDLIANKEVVDQFLIRSKVMEIIRDYFKENEFIEVETPILQNTYGGAQAKPFMTHFNALHQDMFLRISLEIPLKKLLVGGFNRIFEIGKVFRNEGLDRTHNPEFSLLEAYAAYWDYNDLMTFIETLFERTAKILFNTTKIQVGDTEIELKAPWKRMTMIDSIKHYADIDVNALSDEEMKKILLKTPIDKKKLENPTRGYLIAYLFEEFVEAKLIEPHHIIDHPIETTPLCKLHRDPKWRKERIVERFESFILGGEFTNAYSELNDPEIQRELLVDQAMKKMAGDEEANPLDEEFIEAICQGMPPAGGIGMGLDRFVMLFANAQTIKDVIFFPMMRPDE